MSITTTTTTIEILGPDPTHDKRQLHVATVQRVGKAWRVTAEALDAKLCTTEFGTQEEAMTFATETVAPLVLVHEEAARSAGQAATAVIRAFHR